MTNWDDLTDEELALLTPPCAHRRGEHIELLPDDSPRRAVLAKLGIGQQPDGPDDVTTTS